MLRLRGALRISKVRVDFFLVREVKCESSVHLLERQCRIALDHAFRRHALAEEIHERVEGYASVRDTVCTFAEVYVFLRHQTHSHTPTTRRATPLGLVGPQNVKTVESCFSRDRILKAHLIELPVQRLPFDAKELCRPAPVAGRRDKRSRDLVGFGRVCELSFPQPIRPRQIYDTASTFELGCKLLPALWGVGEMYDVSTGNVAEGPHVANLDQHRLVRFASKSHPCLKQNVGSRLSRERSFVLIVARLQEL